MTDVHILGIDTADHLNQLGFGNELGFKPDPGPGYNSWPDVVGWRTRDQVVFAGRYFLTIPAASGGTVGHPWKLCETKGVKGLNPNLKYVVPVQGPGDKRQFNKVQGKDAKGKPVDAATAQGWGTDDASALCDNIVNVVQSGELLYPASNLVIVYLDIEAPGLTLSSDYWSAWASEVFAHPTESLQRPFLPGLYCPTMHNPSDTGSNPRLHRIPSSDAKRFSNVQTGLTAPPNNLGSICWGIWASNPEDPDPGTSPPYDNTRLTKGFQPTWGSPPNNRFDVWQQVIEIGPRLFRASAVPVHIWQYAAIIPHTDANAPPLPPEVQDFDKMHVDFNETADDNAVNWMLVVPDHPPASCQ